MDLKEATELKVGERVVFKPVPKQDYYTFQSSMVPNQSETLLPGKDYFVSPTEVTDWHLFDHTKNLRELPHNGQLFTLRYGYDCDPTNPWHFITKNGSVPMKRFEIQIELSVLSHPIEWEHNCYEQVGEGEVGWILKGSANYDGKDTTVYIPLRKEDGGQYFAGRPVAKSKNAETFIGFGDVGYKTENFDQYLKPGQ